MKVSLLMHTSRSAAVELNDGGIYYTTEEYEIWINEKHVMTTKKVITNFFGLKPDTEYDLRVISSGSRIEAGRLWFRTKRENFTLNVREFGAKGDGIRDDTSFIQAAILACPEEGRILIPKGTYSITSLFLKSNISIELAKDAILSAQTERGKYPVLPGIIESYDEQSELCLGTWEGNPLKMFAGIISGIGVKNIVIYGEGVVDGNASFENWWKDAKVMRTAFRPRLLFLSGCSDIKVQGLLFTNSPSWTIHPYFSKRLSFIGSRIKNPQDSPNTDGIDPESCENVTIAGVHFSLGDDCIALKSGKIYMGARYKNPASKIVIRQCLMEDGHGAVTVGSEMAAGVKNVKVKKCLFLNTDRGLRVKTRRGRGKDAVLDKIVFEDIKMDHVKTPFVVNSFYFCDPDGKSAYVQSREALPVDDRTPQIKKLVFSDITCENCHIAGAHIQGLPERKIEHLEMKNIRIRYADQADSGMPAMADGVEAVSKKGIVIDNVDRLILKNIDIEGQDGEAFELTNVLNLEGEIKKCR